MSRLFPFALAAALLVPGVAEGGTSREPPRTPPIVPGVIVLAAIGAVAIRMNRRGGL
jgi:hypothetical protein